MAVSLLAARPAAGWIHRNGAAAAVIDELRPERSI
jgi:hypothetical protein